MLIILVDGCINKPWDYMNGCHPMKKIKHKISLSAYFLLLNTYMLDSLINSISGNFVSHISENIINCDNKRLAYKYLTIHSHSLTHYFENKL